MANFLAQKRPLRFIQVLTADGSIHIMRRRVMTSAVSLAAVAQPPGVEVKVLEAVDARHELQKAIEEQTVKRKAAEFELAKVFAKEIRTTPHLNIAEAALQRNEAWRATDERAQQQIGALQNILDKVVSHIEQLKTESAEEVTSVLNKKLETLKNALREEELSTQKLQDEIKNLEAEIKKCSNSAVKKR
jgi:hypothetical protein